MRKFSLFALAAAAAIAHASAALAADAADGEKIFKRSCASCHIPTKEGPKRLGPTLFGVVGRPAGSVEDYRYSDANKNSHVTWTPEALNTYLTDPKKFIPGTKMAFAGLKKDDDRANVIAYLSTLK